ncbi:MAG: N-6 DNA methylase [Methylobacter sp.]|nr:N-6 DNA methylase [Methylobacter sp.]
MSELLVAQIQHQQPERVLDLGAGHGALVKAAKNRWPQAAIHAIEPNGQGHSFLRMRFPEIYSQRLCGLDLQLGTQMGLEPEAIDVAVCNPPYLHFKNKQEYQSVFMAAGLPSCPKLQMLTTDVLFLAQNLRLLRKGGELGIIVPDGLLTNKCFQLLREDLLNHHQIFGIIQLPENVFSHTEARTHILLVRRNGVAVDKVPVHLANGNGQIISSVDVKAESLVERMDFQFWHWLFNKPDLAQGVSLASIGADIRRGQFPKKHYENLSLSFFHTSHFPDSPAGVRLSSGKLEGAGLIASKGDILLARVGKRCIGKVAMVTHGQEFITDCVYRIRAPSEFQKKILTALHSESGQSWLKAYAHGVCAQVISKTDLLEFQFTV